MRILSFDISSVSTGFALIEDGKIIKDAYGIIAPIKKASYGARLLYFQEAIREYIKKFRPNLVAIEEIFKGRNMNTFKSLAMFRGVAIKTIFESIGKDPLSLSAVEVRAILDVPTTKEEAFAALTKKYKLKHFDFERDNDVVDALALSLAVHTLLEKGENEKSIRDIRSRKKRDRKRNKTKVQKVSSRTPSRQKQRQSRSRRKV